MNHAGKGGREFNDRVQSARVRTLALTKIEAILKGKKTKMQELVILKLAGTVLPRLNELTGEAGGPLIISFDKAFEGKK